MMNLARSPLSLIGRLFGQRPFDLNTKSGRSKERLRRAALTTLSSGAAKAIALLTSLVSVPLTYRYLGPERYGIWMVLISIIGAMSFADLGIGNGLMNAISEAYGKDDRDLARQHVSSALALMSAIAVVLTLIGAVAFPFLPWLRLFNVKSQVVASEGSIAFLVLYASFVINIPLGVITRAQLGIQKAYVAQTINALGNIASLALILLVIYLHGNLAWLVFATVGTGVIATLLNGWILFREYPWLIPAIHAVRSDSAKKIFKLGILFFVLQCSFTLAYTSDNIVIAQILGAAAVAIYSVPQKLFSLVTVTVSIAAAPFWPAYAEAIARGDVSWVRRVFKTSFWMVLAITIPLCTLLAIAGPWILKVAIGKSFQASPALLVAFAIWGVIYSISMVASVLLNGAGVLKEQAVLSVVAGVSNLVLSIALTRRLGVIGVCMGSIITQFFIVLPITGVLIARFFSDMRNAELKGPILEARVINITEN